jgi:hypothetical protein
VPMPNGSVKCFIHVYNATAEHIVKVNVTTETIDSYDFEWDATQGIYNTTGTYPYIFSCNNSGSGGFVSSTFTVTKEGSIVQSNASIDLTGFALILGLMFAFFVLATAYLYHKRHPLYYMMLVFSTLFVVVIAFIAWRVASEAALSFTPVMFGLFIVSGIMFLVEVYFVMTELTVYFFNKRYDKASKDEMNRFGYVGDKGRL